MARFEREAQLLASLNDPNIAAIYGLEESTDVRALARGARNAKLCVVHKDAQKEVFTGGSVGVGEGNRFFRARPSTHAD
jgi:hypothetical protein